MLEKALSVTAGSANDYVVVQTLATVMLILKTSMTSGTAAELFQMPGSLPLIAVIDTLLHGDCYLG